MVWWMKNCKRSARLLTPSAAFKASTTFSRSLLSCLHNYKYDTEVFFFEPVRAWSTHLPAGIMEASDSIHCASIRCSSVRLLLWRLFSVPPSPVNPLVVVLCDSRGFVSEAAVMNVFAVVSLWHKEGRSVRWRSDMNLFSLVDPTFWFLTSYGTREIYEVDLSSAHLSVDTAAAWWILISGVVFQLTSYYHLCQKLLLL